MGKLRLYTIHVLALALLLTPPLRAQVGGKLEGVITDSSKSVVPGAMVTATNTETGIARESTTNAQGRFVFNALPPARYDIAASMTGFKTTLRQSITVSIGGDAIIDLTLEVGTVAEQVTVTSEAPLIETRSATVGGVVEEKTIREIPLNGRSFSNLMVLEPGVIFTRAARPSTTAGTGEKMSLGGARPQQISFLLDGADMMGKDGTTPAGASGMMLGVDTIQEFRVSSSAFGAEYGRNAGGVVSAVTKSGTNTFHGTAFHFLRNDNLDAAQWEDNAFGRQQPEFKRNQFGFTLGGPILRDKTFFFGSFEGVRERLGNTSTNVVPNTAVRAGAVAASIRPYLAIYPLPNVAGSEERLGGGVGQYSWAGSTNTNQDDFLARVDHQLTNNDSLSGRVYFDDGARTNPTSLGLLGNIQDSRIQSYLANYKRIFGASVVNDFRIAYTRTRLTADDLIPGALNALEYISGRGFGILNPGSGIQGISTGGTNPAYWTQNIFEYIDDMALTNGSHTVKLGGLAKRIQFNGFSAARFRGQYDFRTLTEFLAGDPNQYEAANVFAGPRGLRQWMIGMYMTDEWRVTPRLTMNIGLRYEFVNSPTEVAGRIANLRNQLDPDVTVGNPYFLNPSLKNLAPRFGIVFDPIGDGKTSIRGGFGIYHDQLLQLNYRVGAFRVLPFQQRFLVVRPPGAAVSGIPFPNAGDNLLSQPPALHDSNVQIDITHWNPHQPYAMQFNLTMQRQVASNVSVMLGYLGSQTRNNARNVNWNTSLPTAIINGEKCWSVAGSACFTGAATPRRNRNFSAVLQREFDSNSNYNSLQAQITKRSDKGLTFSFVYQLSRTMDEISGLGGSTDFENITSFAMDPEDRGRDYSRAAFDIRNYLTVNGSYAIPLKPLSGVANKILGGWRISSLLNYSSGEPFTVVNAFDRAGNNTRIFGNQERPSVAPGASNNPTSGTTAGCTFVGGIAGPYNPAATTNSVVPGQALGTPYLWYDPCAFQLQSSGVLGNLGRNTVQGPNLLGWDLAMLKDFTISESSRVEFRWELFNILNRPNFGSPNFNVFQNPTSVTPGATSSQISSTRTSARQMQFALKYIF
ncbi:MAG: TonB-dependent receptor [Acidobacteria bacterium]|nr:TonB-dependent receptor [Acidobacteriota bacterium]